MTTLVIQIQHDCVHSQSEKLFPGIRSFVYSSHDSCNREMDFGKLMIGVVHSVMMELIRANCSGSIVKEHCKQFGENDFDLEDFYNAVKDFGITIKAETSTKLQ